MNEERNEIVCLKCEMKVENRVWWLSGGKAIFEGINAILGNSCVFNIDIAK